MEVTFPSKQTYSICYIIDGDTTVCPTVITGGNVMEFFLPGGVPLSKSTVMATDRNSANNQRNWRNNQKFRLLQIMTDQNHVEMIMKQSNVQ